MILTQQLGDVVECFINYVMYLVMLAPSIRELLTVINV